RPGAIHDCAVVTDGRQSNTLVGHRPQHPQLRSGGLAQRFPFKAGRAPPIAPATLVQDMTILTDGKHADGAVGERLRRHGARDVGADALPIIALALAIACNRLVIDNSVFTHTEGIKLSFRPLRDGKRAMKPPAESLPASLAAVLADALIKNPAFAIE